VSKQLVFLGSKSPRLPMTAANGLPISSTAVAPAGHSTFPPSLLRGKSSQGSQLSLAIS